MLPTLNDGDLILISKIKAPKTGSLVLLKMPNGNGTLIVKRLLGIESDELTFQNGRLSRNGVLLQEDYIFGGGSSGSSDNTSWKIKRGHCLVLSDNRLEIYSSSDSRTFGQIPTSSLMGSLIMRLYPSPKLYS